MDSSPAICKYEKAAALLASESRTKVMVVPDTFLELSSSGGTKRQTDVVLANLPHPGTGVSTLWGFHSQKGEVFQLFRFEEKCRSWFMGNYVLEDGSLCCLVPVDPLFLVIPYLQKAKEKKVFQMLDQLLTDAGERSEGLDILVQSPELYLKDLDLICSSKDFQGNQFVKLSKQKLAAWLKAKTTMLSCALEEEQVNVSTTVAVSGYFRSKRDGVQTKDMYNSFAFGILCDYLPPKLRVEMAAILGLDTAIPDTQEKKLNENTNGSTDKSKKRKATDAEEDYTKSFKFAPPAAEKKLTVAQKKLRKVDKTGMKSISSYFTRAQTKE